MTASAKLLGLVWVLAALAVGVLGWLLFAISESGDDRRAGGVLLGLGIAGLLTGIALLTRGAAASSVALGVSVAFVLGGVAAVLLARADGQAFTSDLLWIGGVPIVAGVVTGLMALGARRAPAGGATAPN